MNIKASEPRRAFTLVELLAVIAIIALLMGILIPGVSAARNQAKKSKTRATVSALAKACETFSTDVGKYPQSGGENPFEPRDNREYLSGAQWLALQLAGGDQLGYVKPDRSNDFDANGFIDHEDWRKWYNGFVADRLPRLGPYIPDDADVLPKLEDYGEKHPGMPDGLKVRNPELKFDLRFFVDAFGYPIIYYRANAGAKAPVTTGDGSSVSRGVYTQSDNAQFTGSDLAGPTGPAQEGYDFANTGKSHHMKVLGYRTSENTEVEPETFVHAIYSRGVYSATERSSGPGRIWPYNAKSFLIISPGKDGLFGTIDDIKNFDTGG